MFTSDLSARIAYCALTLLVLVLQYHLWIGDGSVADVVNLRHAITAQKQQNEKLRERNFALDAEVIDLKTALEAVEERARLELGMIREGETFYRVVEPESASKPGPR